MPYFQVTLPAATVAGQTVDARIDDKVVARVTLLSEQTLRIEPDENICRIVSAITENSETTMHVLRAGKIAFKTAIDR